MKAKVNVRLKEPEGRSYPIIIGADLFPGLVKDLKRRPPGPSYALVSDSKVMRLYGNSLAKMMRAQGIKVRAISFPAGEKSKTRAVKARIEDKMLKLGFGRDCCVIALGGGVTGDLAGFVAATYMRGVHFIQVPTSLLAMVDSSVGGKTGVDLPDGKNLIGAFYQPIAVYASLDTLDTLPAREYTSGLAEVVKSAVILDRGFFSYLEKNHRGVLSKDGKVLRAVVKRSCSIKAAVVEADERESDLRRILNYGHTIGHAIEAAGSYRVPHGFAVSVGMALEGMLACDLGFFPRAELERQNRLLERLKLPVRLKDIGSAKNPRKLLDIMSRDKKAEAGRIRFVFPARIGEMKVMMGKAAIGLEDRFLLGFLKLAMK